MMENNMKSNNIYIYKTFGTIHNVGASSKTVVTCRTHWTVGLQCHRCVRTSRTQLGLTWPFHTEWSSWARASICCCVGRFRRARPLAAVVASFTQTWWIFKTRQVTVVTREAGLAFSLSSEPCLIVEGSNRTSVRFLCLCWTVMPCGTDTCFTSA